LPTTNTLLPHSILNSANRFPDREAFTDGQQVLTHSQMADRMKQLADMLDQLGVKKGDRIGIYMNRCMETAIAIYGIMYLGAVYVPLDPKAPIHRTNSLVKNCDIGIIISHPPQRKKIENIFEEDNDLHTIVGLPEEYAPHYISWEEVYEQSSNFRPGKLIKPTDLAYIMYTSGSTGQPKGIMHTHFSGLSYARLSADLYGLNENDKIGNHAPIHFDISTLGYFTAPLVGATTLIVPDAYTIMPASLSQLMAKERLTVWYSVPLAMIQLLQKGLLKERDLSSLKWILYGGEPFPPKYMRALMKHWPNAQFCNVYGPAEVNQCTNYQIPTPPVDNEPIPIGDVWAETKCLIINEEDEVVQKGKQGELLIHSTTRMKGYWQNDVLTQQSLYTHTNSDGKQEIYYRTGDLFHRDEQNRLQFNGRKDHQVKIRGYRVELDAVEALLVTHPAILESAVFTVQNNDSKQIQAAVILNESTRVDKNDLIAFLKQQLPYYAVPEKIHTLDAFPRTGSGKIKRSEVKKKCLEI